MVVHRGIALVGAMAISMISLGDAAADEGASPSTLPASGTYSARHTLTGEVEGVELVAGVAAAKVEFRVDITNDAGSGFLHQARGHCVGVSLYQTKSATGSGICAFEDADGDVLYMQFAENPYDEQGTANSIGGTGKYEKLIVEQTHRTLESDQLDGSRFEATGTRQGTWKTRGN